MSATPEQAEYKLVGADGHSKSIRLVAGTPPSWMVIDEQEYYFCRVEYVDGESRECYIRTDLPLQKLHGVFGMAKLEVCNGSI